MDDWKVGDPLYGYSTIYAGREVYTRGDEGSTAVARDMFQLVEDHGDWCRCEETGDWQAPDRMIVNFPREESAAA